MKHTAKVSVIIPVYNSSEYLEATILSAINQNIEGIEIVIIDDGSSDDSLFIAKKYQSDNVQILEQKNKGACYARNLGIHHSTGQYIQFLDADDILAPDKISDQLKLFSQYGDEIIVSGGWGRFYGTIDTVKWEKQLIDKDYANPIDWLTESWLGNGMAQTATWLTPRHLIEKAGSWNENLHINQDGEFFCRVLMQASAIKFCESSKLYYRSGLQESISHAHISSEPKVQSLLTSYKAYEVVLQKQDTAMIRKALGHNYLNLIYRFYDLYPYLCLEADSCFRQLGFNKPWPIGSHNFRKLVGLFGFYNTLRLRHFLVKLKLI